ncbi:LuxE/PaaK family acyltransferase [Dyadobacter sandarakinus]|uniref:Acyl transferase n=1 Tax=Dyadobacter sandarakinus TaxID=2747268 RepID=A0ABX7I4S3_9BACT|nr:acyl transferase [Dyadobacter sandarakinus]QRR01089.1 acyl transferase [Dyadobacter sandarakinus]
MSQDGIRSSLRSRILHLQPREFDVLALDIFRYQARFNPLYSEYVQHLGINPETVGKLTQIPFLPIQFFKSHEIRTGDVPAAEVIFQSSGTTGQVASRHFLYDAGLYKDLSLSIFEKHYGPLNQYHILALLPSYLERSNSSLVYMMQHFISCSDSPFSGFYLHNAEEMLETVKRLVLAPDGRKILLLGVTFALLDLAESNRDLRFMGNAKNVIIMDTGGMKGRREELLREEVHDILCDAFGVQEIHSEYGMTELLSQGYSQGGGLFRPGTSMRVLLREVNDPFSISDHNVGKSKTGGINVIDLGNLDTCSFIETQDLGRFGKEDHTFYVMGRFDNSDIRGCNLMVL